MKTIHDIELKSKVVFLRVDLNVPMQNGKITDNSRVLRIIPTIKCLIEKGARIILASHSDRPNGKVIESMSLINIRHETEQQLNHHIEFVNDCVGDKVQTAIKNLQDGQILLLENLRFYKGEETNDVVFAKQLSYGIDIYINDAFACSHRKHASIVGIAKYVPAFAGLLIEEEINNLNAILNNTGSITAIIGGKKVSTKFKVLTHLADKVDNLIIVGAMASTFMKAQGLNLGKSYIEEELIFNSSEFLNKTHKANIYLPTDFTVLNNQNSVSIVEDISDDDVIYDLGTDSVIKICSLLDNANIVLWNGPLGFFEDDRFSTATMFIAKHIAKLTKMGKIKSIIGGGDTIHAIQKAGVSRSISYISTAGGAFLEYLESGDLPGISVLRQ